jgi:hypothetical protein
MTTNTSQPEDSLTEAKFEVTRQKDEQVRQRAETAHRLVLEKIAELRALRLAKAAPRPPDDAAESAAPRSVPETKRTIRKQKEDSP